MPCPSRHCPHASVLWTPLHSAFCICRASLRERPSMCMEEAPTLTNLAAQCVPSSALVSLCTMNFPLLTMFVCLFFDEPGNMILGVFGIRLRDAFVPHAWRSERTLLNIHHLLVAVHGRLRAAHMVYILRSKSGSSVLRAGQRICRPSARCPIVESTGHAIDRCATPFCTCPCARGGLYPHRWG
jgi:hypothetical protein